MEQECCPSTFSTAEVNTTAFADDGSPGESTATKVVRIVGYTILFIVGVIGNSMVILAVRKPKMKTVTNILIANLGMADLLVALLNIPSVVTYAHLWQWPFGEVLCKVLPFIQGLTLTASVCTLLGIALDRYWHIVNFRRRKITLKEAYKMIALAWVFSSIIPMPLLIFCKVLVVSLNGNDFVLCEEVWPNMASRKAYTMVLFLVLYLFPLLGISFLYAVIVFSFKGQPVVPSSREASKHRAQKRVIRMLVTVVILFALCWLPYHVVFIYIDFFSPARNQALVTSILFSQWLVFASSAVNPVVYALLNQNYRKEFFRMLAFCKMKIKRNSKHSHKHERDTANQLESNSAVTTRSCVFVSSV